MNLEWKGKNNQLTSYIFCSEIIKIITKPTRLHNIIGRALLNAFTFDEKAN